MSCDLCHTTPPSVCTRCLSQNLTKFHGRVNASISSNKGFTEKIQAYLARRLPATSETSINLQNIRRETLYTQGLVVKGQIKVDELRDKVASRREALESARKSLHDFRQASCNRLKAQNKSKRKEWKVISEKISIERRRLVRSCIVLHRLRPTIYRQDNAKTSYSFEIGNMSLPSIFHLRGMFPGMMKDNSNVIDYNADQINHVFGVLANLTALVAQYLGIKLPYMIILPMPGTPITSISSNATIVSPFSLWLDDDVQVFAEALARLTIDIQYLCKSQDVSFRSDEDDLGKMLYSLLTHPTVGQYSDDTAYSIAQDKDRYGKEKRVPLWDLIKLVDKIAEDLSNDPFELVELHLHQSASSAISAFEKVTI